MYILILTVIAIAGAGAVAKGNALLANVLWAVSNPLVAVYQYQIYEFEMAGMFFVYSLIAWYGIYNLGLKNRLKI